MRFVLLTFPHIDFAIRVTSYTRFWIMATANSMCLGFVGERLPPFSLFDVGADWRLDEDRALDTFDGGLTIHSTHGRKGSGLYFRIDLAAASRFAMTLIVEK